MYKQYPTCSRRKEAGERKREEGKGEAGEEEGRQRKGVEKEKGVMDDPISEPIVTEGTILLTLECQRILDTRMCSSNP